MKLLYAIIAFCLLVSYTTFSQTISSNAPLCGNANLTLELSATGGTTYAWKGPNSFTSTQQKPSIKNVNWKNRGVYTVTVDNKTTLTTDVNIKDPVAFTVPKEISVCEGGTLVIEPKSGRLTDSTEIPDYYGFSNNSFVNSNSRNQHWIVKNVTTKDVGNYTVLGESSSNGCPISKFVDVKLNANKDCKSISIEDITKIKMCYGQEIVVPFTTKGNFKVGTKFKAYIFSFFNTTSNSLDNPIAVVEKSPIIIKNIDKYFDQTIAIVIVADDAEKTTAISDYRAFSSSYNYRNNSINSIQTCDSSKLSVNYPNSINSLQWYLDGNVINGANKNDFIAKKSGTYSFKFKGDIARDEIDKTCLYESQPVKIELGKIEKPYAYVSNDIELCVGKPATLSISSKANTNYRWKKDGNFIANATNISYQTLQEGKYQIEAKEGTCTAVSDTIEIKNLDKLNNVNLFTTNSTFMDFSNSNKGLYKICPSQTYGLSTNLLRIELPKTSKIRWFKNGLIMQDSLASINNLKGEGNYFVKVSYGKCEGISNNINIQISKTLKGDVYSSEILPNNLIDKCTNTNETNNANIGFES